MGPTAAGFLAFLRTAVGVPLSALPDDSDFIPEVYNYAINVAYSGFAAMPNADPSRRSLYATLVYNLGAHVLVSICPDQTGQTFFKALREKLALNSAFGGMITSASDEGTSASAVIPDWVSQMTLDEFDLIKSPWGRTYLRMAQKPFGPWGIS
ncbi:MAG: hypothetical protein N2444_00225 [Methylocystis sp.]|nr:hypothetical protein [Methylocystis sp.]